MDKLIQLKEVIEKEINTYFENTDLFLVDIKVLTNGKIEVFADGKVNITIDECAKISKHIHHFLEESNLMNDNLSLDVSSPGMDRPLFTIEQFALHAGEQVKIKLRSPFDGRRNFQGLLRGVEEQDVVVLVDDHEFLLPIDLIDKANIIPRFD